MKLKIELYVADLDKSIDFYRRVLGLQVEAEEAHGYTRLFSGSVVIALNRRSMLRHNPAIAPAKQERPGRCLEIVFEVDDVKGWYERVVAAGWPVPGGLQHRPWGADDFGVVDPDGFYLRFTSGD